MPFLLEHCNDRRIYNIRHAGGADIGTLCSEHCMPKEPIQYYEQFTSFSTYLEKEINRLPLELTAEDIRGILTRWHYMSSKGLVTLLLIIYLQMFWLIDDTYIRNYIIKSSNSGELLSILLKLGDHIVVVLDNDNDVGHYIFQILPNTICLKKKALKINQSNISTKSARLSLLLVFHTLKNQRAKAVLQVVGSDAQRLLGNKSLAGVLHPEVDHCCHILKLHNECYQRALHPNEGGFYRDNIDNDIMFRDCYRLVYLEERREALREKLQRVKRAKVRKLVGRQESSNIALSS